MAAALPIMQLAGGAVSAVGTLKKGQMTADSLNTQAATEDQQAIEALHAGQYDVFRQGLKSNLILGHAQAAYGASGVSSSSTSEQSVLAAGAMNAELDRQNILHGADLRALNYKNQASLDRFGANSALEGSYFSALGSVLGSSGGAVGSFITPGAGNTQNPEQTLSMTNRNYSPGQTDLVGPEGVPLA